VCGAGDGNAKSITDIEGEGRDLLNKSISARMAELERRRRAPL
jgi:hypothetical protein